ncbi:MAG: hypothetical protein JWR52_30 [Marmoricola sp.]|nr:hypothetical protein [Marmoricola sp.]
MTSHHRRVPAARLRLTIGLAGMALALVSVAVLLLQPPGVAATGPVVDGSDWGSSGVIGSDSAVTVRWDNTGNPASSLVYRDSRQIIPHSGGANYLGITQSVNDAYDAALGDQNGLNGMSVTVSQTQNLVDQTINLSIRGVDGGTNVLGGNSSTYLQIFQCWGGLTSTGHPDPGATEPDPATCQVGATGADSRGGSATLSEGRFVGTDPLILDGDWLKYYANAKGDLPFTTISGAVSGSTSLSENSYFNTTTTNELSSVNIGPDGTANRPFETQTGEEAPGLGCGVRPNIASTPTCWLVIVPRISGLMSSSGPIAPSLWAQRLQVKLGFRQAASTCPGGKARTLIAGSELVRDAAASWTPGICDAAKIELGYTKLGDQVARTQFETGANQAVLTSQPIPSSTPAVQVPIALTAPVFAYSMTYLPSCVELNPPPATDAAAQKCGYADLTALQRDWKRAGTPVRSLNLDARLVAKLVTQSYDNALINKSGLVSAPWMLAEPANLASDPEFLRLNPDLVHESVTAGSPALKIDHLVLESIRSDSAVQVWNWILSDADARAFLNGCPDPDGHVVDPFYSTRAYEGCDGQKATLAAKNAADRASTTVSSNYVDQPLIYPPDGSPYPLPTWQTYQAPNSNELPLTVVDWLPTVNSQSDAGRDVAIGYIPQNGNWCDSTVDAATCGPLPGKWSDPKVRQSTGSLGLMAVSDAGTAARFQLATANLCDSAGTHCVGANATSLRKAAERFTTTGHGDLLGPAATADYADGAYPLTVPVYGVVAPSLDLTDRRSYASAFDYLVNTGQRPGYRVGNLPPGYAPLTANLRSIAATGIAALRAVHPPSKPLPPSMAGNGPSSSGGVSGTGSPSGGSSPVVSPPSAPATAGVQPVALVKVGPGHERWAWFTMPLGLGITLLAGLAGPFLRRRSGVKLG